MVWVRSKPFKISEQRSKVMCVVALISVYINIILVISFDLLGGLLRNEVLLTDITESLLILLTRNKFIV